MKTVDQCLIGFCSKIFARHVAINVTLQRLKFRHGVTEALDKNCVAALVLLDSSVAFDVIGQGIVRRRLGKSFSGDIGMRMMSKFRKVDRQSKYEYTT